MPGIGRECLGREKGLWNKKLVPRTGFGVVPVVGEPWRRKQRDEWRWRGGSWLMRKFLVSWRLGYNHTITVSLIYKYVTGPFGACTCTKRLGDWKSTFSAQNRQNL